MHLEVRPRHSFDSYDGRASMRSLAVTYGPKLSRDIDERSLAADESLRLPSGHRSGGKRRVQLLKQVRGSRALCRCGY
jgi:hypothetical protein